MLTGSRVTRCNITLSRIETVWLYRRTPVIIIRCGLLSSVAIAGISYASVKVLVLKLAVKIIAIVQFSRLVLLPF